MSETTTDPYRAAGVDIEAGNRFVAALKPLVRRTRRPGVMADVGGFGGFFALDVSRYQEPVLVAGCDGVGTKLLVALEADRLEGIGVDLVAMCVNDVLVHGAEPLFFLDYLATGRLDETAALRVMEGIVAGCERARTALIGGETAEMPGLYAPGHFDLAGFAVGVVERSRLIDGSEVAVGSAVIGIASSGLHANGFSLVRKLLLEEKGYRLDQELEGLDGTLADALLEPTRIYVPSVLPLFDQVRVLAAAHITGGGLLENLPRVLPRSAKAVVDLDSWPKPPIFGLIQSEGNLPDEQMLRIFNAGIGFVVIVEEPHAERTLELLHEHGERAWEIGRIEVRREEEPAVQIRRGV